MRLSIIKPRTERQRAHAQHYNRARAALILPANLGYPQCSWWANAPRECFTAIAESEAKRMALSKFATWQPSTL